MLIYIYKQENKLNIYKKYISKVLSSYKDRGLLKFIWFMILISSRNSSQNRISMLIYKEKIKYCLLSISFLTNIFHPSLVTFKVDHLQGKSQKAWVTFPVSAYKLIYTRS